MNRTAHLYVILAKVESGARAKALRQTQQLAEELQVPRDLRRCIAEALMATGEGATHRALLDVVARIVGLYPGPSPAEQRQRARLLAPILDMAALQAA